MRFQLIAIRTLYSIEFLDLPWTMQYFSQLETNIARFYKESIIIFQVYGCAKSFLLCLCCLGLRLNVWWMIFSIDGKRDINGMAPHLLVSFYTVCSLLFVEREPNDNNVRLKSLILIRIIYSRQNRKKKHFFSLNFKLNFSSTSYHFSYCGCCILFFFFLHPFASNYLFIVTLHSGIFTSISHWYCYCYLISHSKSIRTAWNAIAVNMLL